MNKQEKANTILSWFQGGGDAYSKYKKEVPDSDVVEYNGARELHDNGMLNKKSILTVIS